MKTLRITRQEAKKLAGESYFVGTHEECFEEAKKYGWLGTFPISRLDGAQFLNTDAPSWSKVNTVLVNETGDEYWYKLLKVSPDWEERKGKYFSGEEFTYWVDKRTGIIAHSNPF